MKRIAIGSLCCVFVTIAGSVGAQSFSIDAFGASVSTGVAKPNDIYTVSPTAAPPAVLPPPTLGFFGDGGAAEVDAFSYGRPLSDFGTSGPVHFSVDLGGFGVAGSAVANEFSAGTGSEAASDVFVSALGGSNALVLDGNGLGTFPNPSPVPALGIAEPATYIPPAVPPFPVALADDVDGFDLRAPVPGSLMSPTGVIYFSMDSFAISSGFFGAGFSPADIFIGFGTSGYDSPAGFGFPPASPSGAVPYALEATLGFPVGLLGNDIDAVVVYDDGDGVYLPGTDVIAFSLRPGSTYIGTPDPISGLAISPGDILVDGTTALLLLGSATPTPAILHTAESLGLVTIRSGAPSDTNLNALDLVAVIPEPSALALASLVGFALAARRRRRGS